MFIETCVKYPGGPTRIRIRVADVLYGAPAFRLPLVVGVLEVITNPGGLGSAV